MRKRRTVVHRGPYAVQHFGDGTVAIVGEPEAGRVSLCILTGGNPSGALTVSGPTATMAQLAQKFARVVLAATKGTQRDCPALRDRHRERYNALLGGRP